MLKIAYVEKKILANDCSWNLMKVFFDHGISFWTCYEKRVSRIFHY